ncbi:hypothetical protein HD595_007367 [Nonomuraea roseoviolacea subsp. carminata]|uniref:Uncharacterized protein n=1 Tax=Nonomuraea roseoviolacea subsp. carminata TaxID=160689 RepID=A0ABT1KB66_9ACTN|nr:hypothetical protein [Nonomuraea roseoviolacea subsp. carminata]
MAEPRGTPVDRRHIDAFPNDAGGPGFPAVGCGTAGRSAV